MPDRDHHGLFSALLKHWRHQRGWSQLDLALAAEVSSRHVSFLETGRSSPSPEMVLRLGATLDIPLRHVNELLVASGHEPHYATTTSNAVPESMQKLLTLMKEHHEPFPLIVVDRLYDVVDANRAAMRLMATLLPERVEAGARSSEAPDLNLLRVTFDPEGAQPFIANFDELGRAILWRLQREVLACPDDRELRALLDTILAMPTVSDNWRELDLNAPSFPAAELHLDTGAGALRFTTMITAFQAPQTVQLEELRLETWYPADAATEAACRKWAGDGHEAGSGG